MEALKVMAKDHADVQVTDLLGCRHRVWRNVQDEEVVEDVDDTAYAMVSAFLVPICSEFWIPLHYSIGASVVLPGMWQSY